LRITSQGATNLSINRPRPNILSGKSNLPSLLIGSKISEFDKRAHIIAPRHAQPDRFRRFQCWILKMGEISDDEPGLARA
jgi:hypothetical protein